MHATPTRYSYARCLTVGISTAQPRPGWTQYWSEARFESDINLQSDGESIGLGSFDAQIVPEGVRVLVPGDQG